MSLSKLYDDIVAKATVNRSSQEIKDISSAMEEMLGRLVSGGMEVIYHKNSFTTTLKFGPSYLQPCGSMAEGTALWKSVKRQGRERKFIEFDYLVILGNQDKVVVIKEGNCQGCMGFNNRNDELLRPRAFCRSFLSALYCKINNMCSCLVDSNDTGTEVDSRPCDSCTVVRSTGYLQFAKIPDISAENVAENVKENEHCSLVLYWTSSTDSFLAPNVETLQSTEKIKRLVIRVDIVPAFEFPDNRDGDKRFIISKLCPHCDCLDCFMVSYCMHEMTAIRHVSEIHKQSYIIIKFLLGQLIYWTGDDEFTNSYYAKVAFLTHCQTCTDEHGDCTKCITEILQSLVDTSGSLKLLKFHQVASLRIREYDVDVTLFQLPLLSLLHVISQLKRHSEKSNSQYRPCHVVGLIKQTCRLLFEGDPGIHEVNGKFKIPNYKISVNTLLNKHGVYFFCHKFCIFKKRHFS